MSIPSQAPAPPDTPTIERPRVLLYSHDGTGLGHLRIVLSIATDLAARRPDASVVVMSGLQPPSLHDLPENVDLVKLPSVPKRTLYGGLPTQDRGSSPHKDIFFVRNAIARATINAFRPHVFVVDHAPAGLIRELTEPIQGLASLTPRPRLVLLMRDITFGPEQTRRIWQREGVYQLLAEAYDRILVYGSREVFDPVAAYGLSALIAAKMTFCGYLTPPAPTAPALAVRDRLGVGDGSLVAVSVGGGADGAPLLRAYLSGLRQEPDLTLHSFVVTGPLLPEDDRQEIMRLALDLPRLTIVPYAADWIDVLHAADAVVCMGGYNSLVEAAFAGQRAVVVPRRPGPEEQILRARAFADRGLVTMVPPDALQPDRLRTAITRTLAHPISPHHRLPFTGSARIVAELATLLPR